MLKQPLLPAELPRNKLSMDLQWQPETAQSPAPVPVPAEAPKAKPKLKIKWGGKVVNGGAQAGTRMCGCARQQNCNGICHQSVHAHS